MKYQDFVKDKNCKPNGHPDPVGPHGEPGGLKDLNYATDVILQLRIENDNLRAQLPRWIPVTERLPEYDVRVLAIDVYDTCDGDGTEFIGIWTRKEYPDDPDGCCWIDERGWWHAIDEVTHWMPLPEPPEEKNNGNK